VSALLLPIAGFFCGFAGAWVICRWAFRWGLVDVPSLRSSHSLPTPRGGGVGILLTMVLAGSVLKCPPWFCGIPGILGVVSFFDDRLQLSVRTRLGFQFFSAGAWILLSQGGGELSLGSVLLVLFWGVFVVGSGNFFNFMDGINGIAGITGAVCFGMLALFGFVQSLMPQAMFCLTVAAACIGFLPLNFPRARVFLGDVGSIPLGFVFGTMVLNMTSGSADFLCLSSFLFLFYADAVSTLFIRWRSGEQISQPHRRHLYQLLVNELNYKHASVSLVYGGLQLVIGMLMLLAWQLGPIWQTSFFFMLTSVFLLATRKVRYLPQVNSIEGGALKSSWN